jgi:hypothetical protein
MAELPDEYLGKSPSSFKRMRESLGSDPVGNIDIKWKGRLVQIPVYRISIKDLRYNLFNTRIKPHLLQNIAEHSRKDDYFHTEVDKDSLSTQKMINGFLRKNHDRKDALNHFKNPKNEPIIQEPLVATPDGRVLNGNQRLCVFRELFFSNMTKYEKLQQAYVAFLPDNGTAEDERELEATFQETKLAAVPFDWIQSGLWAIEEMKKGKTPQQIGKTLGLSEQDVRFEVKRIQLAQEFLDHIGKANYWQELREMNLKQAFKTLAQQLNSQKDRDKRETLKDMTFKILTDPKNASKEVGKTVHVLIGELAKNIESFEVSSEDGDDKEQSGGLNDDLLKPRAKKSKKPSSSKEKINLKKMKPAEVTRIISDTAEVAKKTKEAKNEKTFAQRQMKSTVTTLDKILENWEKQEKKGLKSKVNAALKKLEQIKELLDE